MGLFDIFKTSKFERKVYQPYSNVSASRNTSFSAIEYMHNNKSTIGEQRHINSRYIIDNFANSTNPLDILAVAIAYENEGAAFRHLSIAYYERFLTNPVDVPNIPNAYIEGKPVKMFSNWCIYSSLAKLYEKEYDYKNAIKYLKKLPKESKYNNPADYRRIGDVLAKIDIDQCVEYYKDLKKQAIYTKFQGNIDSYYAEALEKQAKGYKYKPRKKTK